VGDLPSGWYDVDLGPAGPGVYRFARERDAPLVADFIAGVADPEAAMATSLARILDSARGTPFAEQHGLDAVRTLAEYQDAVPVRPFAAFADDLADPGRLTRHPVVGTLRTSGTSGAPKLLPITRPWLDDVRACAAIWRLGALREHPETAKGAVLGALGPGTGTLTGLLYADAPVRWAVPDLDAIADPEIRAYAALRLALGADVRSWVVANPAVVVAACRAIERHHDALAADLADGTLVHGPAAALDPAVRQRLKPALHRRRLADLRPGRAWDLAVIHAWTGGTAGYFAGLLPEALGADVPIRELGVGATEGIVAIGMHTSWRGGVAVPGGPLVELVPEAGGAAIPVHAASPGDYRLILSTTAGLYRYDLDDVVRIEGRWGAMPVLSFVRKGADVISTCGERVTADQLALVMRELGVRGRFVAAGRLAPRPWLVIAAASTIDADALDRALCAVNLEYARRRSQDRLGPIQAVVVEPPTFDRLREARIAAGASPSQVKEPIVVTDDILKRQVTGGR
jgi:hypothetical protein